jgi:hypothetical protein
MTAQNPLDISSDELFPASSLCRTTLLNQDATVLCRGPSTQGTVDGRIRPANGTEPRYLKRLSALMQVKLDAQFPVSLIISSSYRAVLLRTRPPGWGLSLALHHHPCRLSKSRHSFLLAIGEAALLHCARYRKAPDLKQSRFKYMLPQTNMETSLKSQLYV